MSTASMQGKVNSSTELEVRPSGAVALQDELTVEQLTGQVQLIQQAMKAAMKRGEHYGTIPGAGSKQVLFKAGAEKLCLLFRLDSEYDVSETYHEDGHYTVRVTCTLFHIPTGLRQGSGVGLCTTREGKYAKIRGADNPNLPNTYNTVLKMACKRAQTAAVLTTTGASDIFTQDLEDVDQPAPALELATDTTLAELVKMLNLVSYAPELWAPDVVLTNASRRFGRSIVRLADLSEKEAQMVIKGTQQYFTDNPPGEEAEEKTIVRQPKPEAKTVSEGPREKAARIKSEAAEAIEKLQAAQAGEPPEEVLDVESEELPDDGIDWPGTAPV